MTRIFKPAAFAAALLLTTALAAHAANTAPRGDQMRPGIDPVTTRSITSPGDPFLPDNGPKPGKSPMPAFIECWMELDEDGHVTIYFKNISDETLPPGPNFPTKLGDGDHFTLKPWDTWEPGEVKTFGKSNYDGPLTCTTEYEAPEDDDDVPH